MNCVRHDLKVNKSKLLILQLVEKLRNSIRAVSPKRSGKKQLGMRVVVDASQRVIGDNAETSTLLSLDIDRQKDISSFLSARNRFCNHFPSKRIRRKDSMKKKRVIGMEMNNFMNMVKTMDKLVLWRINK